MYNNITEKIPKIPKNQ